MKVIDGGDWPRRNGKIYVELTVLNTGTSSVTVTSVNPNVTPIDAAMAVGRVNLGGPNQSVTVAANGGTLTTGFGLVVFEPHLSTTQSSTEPITVGAVVYTSDGSVVVPPSQVITLRLISAAAPSDGGNFLFTSPLDATNWFTFF